MAAENVPNLTGKSGVNLLALQAKRFTIAFAYFFTAWIGLTLADAPGYATAVWAPSGIALAAALLWGTGIWPGIWFGSFLINAWIPAGGNFPPSWPAVLVAMAIATGSTLQAWIGIFLIQRFIHSANPLNSPTNVFKFIGCETVSCLTASSIGVASLYLARFLPAAALARNWMTWWLGDLVGIFVFTPLILAWQQPSRGRLQAKPKKWRGTETLFLGIFFCLLAWIVFGGRLTVSAARYPIGFMLLPFILWAACRYGARGNSSAVLMLALTALWGTLNQFGPFVRPNLHESLLLLQAFIGVASVMGLSLTAALEEVYGIEENLRRAHAAVQESEERYRALVELCPDAILVQCEGRISYINSAGCKLFGARNPQDLTGKNITDFMEPYKRDAALSPMEFKLRRIDGSSTMFIEAASIPVQFEGKTALQVVLRDITEHKRYEEELRQTRDVAQQASLAKSRFLTNMSHELRTPLNSIIGFTHVLLKQGALWKENSHMLLQRAHDNSKHLLNIINDIIDLARVEKGRLDLCLEPVDVKALVKETIAELEGQWRDRPITVTTTAPDHLQPLQTDRIKLKQILINLLGNAIKFTQSGTIEIKVSADITNLPAMIEVKDSGIGMNEKQLQKIFDPFWQADDSNSRRYQGSGLGLAICKQICHALGYTLSVTSEPGRGTAFLVRLSKGRGAEMTERKETIVRRLKKLDEHRLALRTMELFFHYMPARLHELNESLTTNNLESLARAAHSMKASSANIGAIRLHDLAANLERQAQQAMPKETLVSLIEKTYEECGKIFNILGQLQNERRSPSPLVAVVEDNADNRLLLEAILASQFSLHLYEDGQQALDGMRRCPPAAVILDISLPGMDGLEVLNRMRQNSILKNTPAIAVTAHAMAEHRHKYLQAGFNDYITKPIVDEEMLINSLRRLINQRTATDALPDGKEKKDPGRAAHAQGPTADGRTPRAQEENK